MAAKERAKGHKIAHSLSLYVRSYFQVRSRFNRLQLNALLVKPNVSYQVVGQKSFKETCATQPMQLQLQSALVAQQSFQWWSETEIATQSKCIAIKSKPNTIYVHKNPSNKGIEFALTSLEFI